MATTLVDHTGRGRGRVHGIEQLRYGEHDDPPSEWDPDTEIQEIADHAANVAALRAPVLMAGALMMRAWIVEAREHENELDQRIRDLLGYPGQRVVSPDELRDAEMRARLIGRNRSSAELCALARLAWHVGFQYRKLWATDIEDLRRVELAEHEGEVLMSLARKLDQSNANEPAM